MQEQRLKLMKSEHVYDDLSIKLGTAILEGRKQNDRRAIWAVIVNWSTLSGLLLAAIFIAYTIAGDVATGGTTVTNSEESEMTTKPDRPTIVEPPDEIQTDDKSRPRPKG